MGRGGGSRAAGAIAHMEMGEVFKTAGFRRARGREHGFHAETRTVTTRVAPSKGSRMALSLKVTNTPGATSSR